MRTALGGLAAVLLVILVGLQPAQAATTPPKVGLVSFISASYSTSTGTAGLTIDWPDTRYAKSYQVYISRSYTMSNAKRYGATASAKTFTGLVRGVPYFVQVRALNGSAVGQKSSRVGHPTILRIPPGTGPTYRVMTYNVCSQKCSGWDGRQPAALGRIRAYSPDVIAGQEAVYLSVPTEMGYAEAIEKSSKRLLYKTSRFTLAPATTPVPAKPAKTADGCDATWPQSTKGYVLLGYHGGGCRYAVWAVLVDKQTGDRTVFVDVHTVSGDTETAANQRTAEVTTLTRHLAEINPGKLPVVYAGDFNSNKSRSNDGLSTVFHKQGYYDAYDLASKLRLQHNNSYNGFDVVPRISYKWGDHVDHVWIRPDEGRILSWANGAYISGGRMVTPIPSDHSPVITDVRLSR
jgi:endonuclease/exonuclease/phosphatase family metal-dependent hydrolase